MSESGILEAIEADFGFARDAVIRNTHEMEKTVVLTIFVDNLVDGTGRTEVAYILGFRSRTLIQVSLIWRLAPGTAAHSRQLQWAADAITNPLPCGAFRASTFRPPRSWKTEPNCCSAGRTIVVVRC